MKDYLKLKEFDKLFGVVKKEEYFSFILIYNLILKLDEKNNFEDIAKFENYDEKILRFLYSGGVILPSEAYKDRELDENRISLCKEVTIAGKHSRRFNPLKFLRLVKAIPQEKIDTLTSNLDEFFNMKDLTKISSNKFQEKIEIDPSSEDKEEIQKINTNTNQAIKSSENLEKIQETNTDHLLLTNLKEISELAKKEFEVLFERNLIDLDWEEIKMILNTTVIEKFSKKENNLSVDEMNDVLKNYSPTLSSSLQEDKEPSNIKFKPQKRI